MAGALPEPNQVLAQQNASQWAGYVPPNTYTQYGVLPPAQTQPNALLGQAGYTGTPSGGFMSGISGGFNTGQQIKGAYRVDKEYQAGQQQKRLQARQAASHVLAVAPKDRGDPGYGEDQQNRADAQQQLNTLSQPQGLAGFFSKIGEAVHHLSGHPGQTVLPGAPIPTPQAPQAAPQGPQAPPVQEPTGGAPGTPGAVGAPGSQPQGLEMGGPAGIDPVPTNAFNEHTFTQGHGYAQGGPVIPSAAYPALGQVTSAGTQGQQPPNIAAGGGWRGFADGGSVGVGPPGGQVAPPQPMAGPPQGQATPGTPPGMAGAPGSLPPQVDPREMMMGLGPAGVKYYQGLASASLNDKGEPQGREAVPSAQANPNVAMQDAQNNPAAMKGVPSDSPEESGKPAHSLSASWYDNQDQLASLAASHAAMAGHDPQAVYAAMNNMTTSFLQTHIMREAGAAAVAMQNGNMPAVEKALKNMYYYIPDGQELKTQKVGGQLMYQNPIFPYLDKNGQPTDQGGAGAQPNMQPVDAQHIAMIGQAALDPLSIGRLIMDSRAAYAKMTAEKMTAQGQLYRGQGIAASGQGALERGQAELQRVSSQNYKDLAAGDMDRAKAAAAQFSIRMLRGQNLDPALSANVKQVGPAMDDILLGPLKTQDPNSLSPAAGKNVRDNTRAMEGSQQVSGEDYAKLQATATGLAAKGVPARQAALIAWQAYKATGQTHPAEGDPSPAARAQGKGNVPNVFVDRDAQGNGVLHIWTGSPSGGKGGVINRGEKGGGWQTYPMDEGSGAALAGGERAKQQWLAVLGATMGGGSQPNQVLPGGAPDQTAAMDAADQGGSSGSSPSP
jgi:hypothetical protein